MKPAIHYVVKTKRINYKSADDIDFIEDEVVFENESPIVARNEAFNYYQSFIEVLLQSIGKDYTSDKQTRIDLKDFREDKVPQSNTVNISEGEMTFNFERGNTIGVYMVVDKHMENDDFRFADHLIHEIGFSIYDENSFMNSLNNEFEYYSYYKYDTGELRTYVTFCDANEWEEGYRSNEPATYSILKTPFDWTGYDEPYWWLRTSDGEPPDEETKLWARFIDGGEGKKVEFKSTLRYSIHKKKADKVIEHSIAKTIAAFLNTDGGFLLVGIDDDGQILGLGNDFSLYNKNSLDNFLIAFRNILKSYFGLGIIARLDYDFSYLGGKRFFYVEMSGSERPIYLNNYGVKEFYVRVGTTSSKMDVEEAVEYITNCNWEK